jgi:ribonuclease HI
MTTTPISATKATMPPRRLKIYFDGGCRPNPGQMETAVVTRGSAYFQPECGMGTSNDAEWLALIHAAEVAISIGAHDVVLLGDSALVVGQANQKTKCRREEFRLYLERFQDLARSFERIKIRKIARTQNLAGIALERARL